MRGPNRHTKALAARGVSLWLDDLSRDLLESGQFAEYVEYYSVTGATSNPTIFAKALRKPDRYAEQIAQLCATRLGRSPGDLFLELALSDVTDAAEVLRPVYEHTRGADGYVSFECTPGVAHDAQATVDQALEIAGKLAGAPNTMIKVPATDAGLVAIEELTGAGVNVNVTLVFSVERYVEVAEAFFRGLERRAAAGLRLDHVRSVASVFVSRLDAKADAQLPGGSNLRRRVAILNAKAVYRQHQALLSSPRWVALAERGAHPQRPLWASMAPKKAEYRDVIYMEALALPGTVATVPQETIRAFAYHGNPERPEQLLRDDLNAAEFAHAKWALDLDGIARELEAEGVAAFATAYDAILEILGRVTEEQRQADAA